MNTSTSPSPTNRGTGRGGEQSTGAGVVLLPTKMKSIIATYIKNLFRNDNNNKDGNLVLAKLLFFCVSMSTVGWQRFQNNFYLENGLNTSQVGTLKAIGLLFKFIADPIFCFLSDISNPKYILMEMLCVQILTIWMMKALTKPIGYYSIFLIKILRATTAPTGTITTSASFKLTEGTSEGFGQQRMFGSLAWGLGALFCGWLIDLYGMTAVFYYTNAFNIVTLVLVYFLPLYMINGDLASKNSSNRYTSSISISNSNIELDSADSSSLSENTKLLTYSESSNSSSTTLPPYHGDSGKKSFEMDSSSNSSNKESSSDHNKVMLKRVTRNEYKSFSFIISTQFKAHIYENYHTILKFLNFPTSRTLLLNVFVNGIVMTVPDTFLYISLEKDYHASRKFSGFCTSVSIISAMPLFWYSDHLIKKYGHCDLIFVSQIVGVLRLFLYFLVPLDQSDLSLNIILSIQLLHGFQFSLFWAACVDLIYKISPKDLTASCLSTLNVVYFTLAGAVGNLLWSFLYEYAGTPAPLYLFSSILSLLNALYFRSQSALISSSPDDRSVVDKSNV